MKMDVRIFDIDKKITIGFPEGYEELEAHTGSGETPAPSSAYEELLALIPNTPDTRSIVFLNDYVLLRKAANVALPGPGANQQALQNYLQALVTTMFERGVRGFGQAPHISGYSEYALSVQDVPGISRHLGFDLRDVDQSALAGMPPGQLGVMLGEFDSAATDAALKNCATSVPDCDPPVLQSHAGINFYSWGEGLRGDLRRRFSPPAFDQFGRGGRIAVQDSHVFYALETSGMNALIEASLDRRTSLLASEKFRLLAKAMSQLDAHASVLSDRNMSVEDTISKLLGDRYSEEDANQIRAQLAATPVLRQYLVFATGEGIDQDGPYMAIALVHGSAEAAEENVNLLLRRINEASSLVRRGMRWSEMVDKAAVRAEGRVLLAKLHGPIAGAWPNFVFQPDTLFAHDGGAPTQQDTVSTAPATPLPRVAAVQEAVATAPAVVQEAVVAAVAVEAGATPAPTATPAAPTATPQPTATLAPAAVPQPTETASVNSGIDDCGNAVGNGAEIISGPSTPEGEDRDSVFRSLTVHPTDPNIVLMGTERNGFVKSTDGGLTWTRHRQGLRWSKGVGYPEIYDMAISPSDPNIVFAATVDSPGPVTGDFPSAIAGIYKSEDGGETWVRKNCGLTNSRVVSVRFDPSDPDLAVAAIGAGERSFSTGAAELPLFFDGGIYITRDGGNSWERTQASSNDNINNFHSIVVTGSDPTVMTTFGLHTPQGGSFDPTFNAGFLRSIDRGESWQSFGTREVTQSQITHFDVSDNGMVIYATITDSYLHWVSTDGGATWTISSLNQGSGPVTMSPADSSIVIFRDSAQTSLYRSSDGLLTYNKVASSEGLTDDPDVRFAFEDIVFAPSDPNIVYAATTGLLVYRSIDGGASFTLMTNIRAEVLNAAP